MNSSGYCTLARRDAWAKGQVLEAAVCVLFGSSEGLMAARRAGAGSSLLSGSHGQLVDVAKPWALAGTDRSVLLSCRTSWL